MVLYVTKNIMGKSEDGTGSRSPSKDVGDVGIPPHLFSWKNLKIKKILDKTKKVYYNNKQLEADNSAIRAPLGEM